jgi:hypothetical protein
MHRSAHGTRFAAAALMLHTKRLQRTWKTWTASEEDMEQATDMLKKEMDASQQSDKTAA